MSLRGKIAAAFVAILGFLDLAVSVASHRQLDRFLVHHADRVLQQQVGPIVEEYLARLGPGAVPLADVARDLARDLTAQDLAVLVLDASGRPLASGKLLPDELEPAPVRADLIRQVRDGAGPVSYVRMSGAGRELVVYVPLHPVIAASAPPIGVVQFNRLLDDIDRSLERLRAMLLATGLITLLAGAGLAVVVSRYLTRPLERLESTSRAIARGLWGRRSDLPHTPDEIGRLAKSFDEMVHRLETAVAAQQRFVADAAHQLKTPLTALGGHLELLERSVISGQHDVRASYQTMRKQVQRLEPLVRRLLTLSALDAGTPLQRRMVDLAALARTVVEEVRPVAGGRRLEVVASGPTTASVDPERIHEVLSNLLDNAIRHTSPTGVIVIEVGMGTLCVRDDGVGIPPDRLDRVFDRFYRYPPNGEGSGLGLAIVRGIAEAHGGTARVESAPGEGTAVTLAFPPAP